MKKTALLILLICVALTCFNFSRADEIFGKNCKDLVMLKAKILNIMVPYIKFEVQGPICKGIRTYKIEADPKFLRKFEIGQVVNILLCGRCNDKNAFVKILIPQEGEIK